MSNHATTAQRASAIHVGSILGWVDAALTATGSEVHLAFVTDGGRLAGGATTCGARPTALAPEGAPVTCDKCQAEQARLLAR